MVHVIVNNAILNSYFQTVAVISQVYAEQPTLGVWLMLVTSTNSNILYTMITAWTQNSVHIPDKDIKSWHKLHYFTHNVFGEKKKRNPHFENAPNSHLKKWLIEHLLNSLHRRIIKNQTRKNKVSWVEKGRWKKWMGKDENLFKQLAQRYQNFIFVGEMAVWEQNKNFLNASSLSACKVLK